MMTQLRKPQVQTYRYRSRPKSNENVQASPFQALCFPGYPQQIHEAVKKEKLQA